MDASLQRLTGTPVETQDADWEIQDQAGAEQATSFARLNILNQPGTALTAQANQLSENVLSLLQSTD
jgi:flagellin-like hook-associated protein FlgL